MSNQERSTALSLGDCHSCLAFCDTTKCDKPDCMILLVIKIFTSRLNEHFSLTDFNKNNPLVLAATLDPCFQKLSVLSNAEQTKEHDTVLEITFTSDCNSSSTSNISPVNKKKLNVLSRLFRRDMDKQQSSSVREAAPPSLQVSHRDQRKSFCLVMRQHQSLPQSCHYFTPLPGNTCYTPCAYVAPLKCVDLITGENIRKQRKEFRL